MDFVGTGKRLAQGDVGNAAREIDLPTAALLSILEIETGGRGFDNKNRPLILPEPHKFYANLGAGAKRDRAVREGLAYKSWGERPYPKSYDARYANLNKMIAIDRAAALDSASWGLPQILGSNAESSGYGSEIKMVEDFLKGEFEQLQAMCRLIAKWGLDKSLRGKDLTKAANWRIFAKGYNGSGYAKHNYHGRLAAAFVKHSGGENLVVATARTLLKNGVKGEAVRNFQIDLITAGYEPGPADGRFGDKTEAATKLFQEANSLSADGKAGAATLKKLAEVVATVSTDTTPKPVWEGQEARPEPEAIEEADEPTEEIERGEAPSAEPPDRHRVDWEPITDIKMVELAQNMLKSKGYTEVGNVDGKVGTMTEAAITAFRIDNGLRVVPIVDMELIVALGNAPQRKLAPARADATPAEVRNQVPEAKSTWFAKMGAMWSAIGLFVSALFNGIFENIGPAKDMLAPVASLLTEIPIFVYLLILAGGAAALWFNSQRAETKSVEAFKTGERR